MHARGLATPPKDHTPPGKTEWWHYALGFGYASGARGVKTRKRVADGFLRVHAWRAQGIKQRRYEREG